MTKINLNKSPEIICFGEALVDRLGPLGGDPVTDKPLNDCLGGAPANVACALSRLGADVKFIGRLGDDLIGENFRDLFLARGVDISCLQIDLNLPTRVVLVKRDQIGERSFWGFNGDLGNGFADELIEIDLLKNNWLRISRNANWFLTGTIPLAYINSSKTLLWSINKCREQGIKIAVDINWRAVFWDEEAAADSGPSKVAIKTIMNLLEFASLIKLSKEEAIWFFNSSDPLQISNSLSQKPDLVVTDGPSPVRWKIDEFHGELDVPKSVSIVDTTGAGDSFMAGLIYQLCCNQERNLSFLNSQAFIRFASACGALVCKGEGAIEPQPNCDQVKDFLDSEEGVEI